MEKILLLLIYIRKIELLILHLQLVCDAKHSSLLFTLKISTGYNMVRIQSE